MIVSMGNDMVWFKELMLTQLSTLVAPITYKALHGSRTEFVFRSSGRDCRVLFNEPVVDTIVEGMEVYDELMSIVNKQKPMDQDHYVPDILGIYVPIRRGLIVEGIYLFIDRMVLFWRSIGHKYIVDPNILLSLVFYHEYFHMLLDKLHIYMDGNDEEVYAELYALAKTTNKTLLDSMLGRGVLDVIYDPIITETLGIDNVEIKLTYAQQPVTAYRFIQLPRTKPYSNVRDYWIKYFLQETPRILIPEMISNNFTKILETPSETRTILQNLIAENIHKHVFEEIKIDKTKPKRCGETITIKTYLVGKILTKTTI